jgi:hypothetical protein
LISRDWSVTYYASLDFQMVPPPKPAVGQNKPISVGSPSSTHCTCSEPKQTHWISAPLNPSAHWICIGPYLTHWIQTLPQSWANFAPHPCWSCLRSSTASRSTPKKYSCTQIFLFPQEKSLYVLLRSVYWWANRSSGFKPIPGTTVSLDQIFG